MDALALRIRSIVALAPDAAPGTKSSLSAIRAKRGYTLSATRPARYKSMAACSLMLAALAGCTTSLSSNPDPATEGDLLTYGIPYRLPATQVSVTVSWVVKNCDPAPLPDPDKPVKPIGNVEFAASGAFTTATIEGESRVIDYRDLTTAFKTGNIKVDYHEKTMLVKSINAEIKGQEAEAVAAAVKFGANAGRVLLGLTAPASSGDPKKPGNRTACSNATLDMLETLKTDQARIKEIPAVSKALEEKMAAIRGHAVNGKLTKKDKADLIILQAQSRDSRTN